MKKNVWNRGMQFSCGVICMIISSAASCAAAEFEGSLSFIPSRCAHSPRKLVDRNNCIGICIADSKISQLKMSAMIGSEKAANRLATFYTYWVGDYAQGNYWLTIAAENGDTLAMRNLGVSLKSEQEIGCIQDIYAKARANFWLRNSEKRNANGRHG